jgi:hypothetical protein
LEENFKAQYASLGDEELLHIAGDHRDLRPEAVSALDVELARRSLTQKHVRAKKRDEFRQEIQEVRAHQPKRNKLKYFVAQINLSEFFIGFAGLMLCVIVTFKSHRLWDEWQDSIFFVQLDSLIAFLAVQPWVRKSLGFWVSLIVASVPQILVGHWLTVYHPTRTTAGLKGTGFLSMLAGWIVGVPLFLLLQRLKRKQDVENNR